MSSNEPRGFIAEHSQAKRIAEFQHAGSISVVLFSPDDRLVVSGSSDGTVKLWEVSERKEMMRIEPPESVEALAFTGDGRYLALAGRSIVGLYPLILDDVIKSACSSLSRNLTLSEWRKYFPDTNADRRTCPALP